MTNDQKTEREVALNLRNIPVSVRAGFKAACCRYEISMTEALVDFMRRVASGSEKLQKVQ